ncbi:MAG: SDR family oxidoreductase [Acidimicrobiia bacterium]
MTGASKGIGRGIAVGLAREGAKVAVGYHEDEFGANETAQLILASGGEAHPVRVDLGSVDDCKSAIDSVAERFGSVDVLVNNAARTRFGPIDETTEVDFDDVVNTVLKGPFFLSIFASEGMRVRGSGSIINISSIAVAGIMPFHGAYTMAKGGLESMTRQMALDLAPQIRVNAVAPGATLTDRNLRYSEGFEEKWSKITPLGRVLRPDDYVGVVAFLASEDAAMITGQVLYVDGGWSILGHGPDMDDFDFSSDKETED